MTPLQRNIEAAKQWWTLRKKPQENTTAWQQWFARLRSVIALVLLMQIGTGILLSLRYQPNAQTLRNAHGKELAPYRVVQSVKDADGDTLFHADDNILLTPEEAQPYIGEQFRSKTSSLQPTTYHDTTQYIPSVAWLSVEFQSDKDEVHWFIRSTHQLCAHLCIALGLLYILCGVATGLYRTPRELGWMASVILLLLMFAAAWSGSVLPWNQRSVAGLAVVSSSIEQYLPLVGVKLAYFLRGGENISSSSLPRVYILHILLLPILMIGSYRFLQSREQRKTLSGMTVPLVIAGILVLGWLLSTMLLHHTSETLPYDAQHPAPNYLQPKPEWYFLDAYYLLRQTSGDVAALLMGGTILLYFLLPFLEQRLRKTFILKSLLWLLTAVLAYCMVQGMLL